MPGRMTMDSSHCSVAWTIFWLGTVGMTIRFDTWERKECVKRASFKSECRHLPLLLLLITSSWIHLQIWTILNPHRRILGTTRRLRQMIRLTVLQSATTNSQIALKVKQPSDAATYSLHFVSDMSVDCITSQVWDVGNFSLSKPKRRRKNAESTPTKQPWVSRLSNVTHILASVCFSTSLAKTSASYDFVCNISIPRKLALSGQRQPFLFVENVPKYTWKWPKRHRMRTLRKNPPGQVEWNGGSTNQRRFWKTG